MVMMSYYRGTSINIIVIVIIINIIIIINNIIIIKFTIIVFTIIIIILEYTYKVSFAILRTALVCLKGTRS